MSDPIDWNKQIIEEFLANDGKVDGYFENLTLLLLHTTGVQSGLERTDYADVRLVFFDDVINTLLDKISC